MEQAYNDVLCTVIKPCYFSLQPDQEAPGAGHAPDDPLVQILRRVESCLVASHFISPD
jgi:hypothetical protein